MDVSNETKPKEAAFASGNRNLSSISSNSKDSLDSDMHFLLQLARDTYIRKLSDIEEDKNMNESQRSVRKIRALETYNQYLNEQSEDFASSMSELEKESQERVKQLEKRLKNSAKKTMEAVLNMHEYEKEIKRVVEERAGIKSLYKDSQQNLSSVKVENSFLRDQNSNLNHDIQALLHVIHHARLTGTWEFDCVTFCEVTPEQVFGPVQSISHIYDTDTDSQLFSREDKKTSTYSGVFSEDTLTSSPRHSQVPPQGKANFSPARLHSSYLPRCASLPEIGNIYNFNRTFKRYLSYDTNFNKRLLGLKFSKHKRIVPRSAILTPELLKVVSCDENLEERLCNRKGQSEPHLFMFDGNIYKYTPCEPIKKSSSTLLNYQSSLPPYQSIDLKFPTEGSTLKINIWNKLKSGSYLDDQENSYLKADSSDSSCRCSGSDIAELNKQMCLNSYVSGSDIAELNKQMCLNSYVYHEEKASKCSIGLQAEADRTTRGTQYIPDEASVLAEQREHIENMQSTIKALKEDMNKVSKSEEEKRVLLNKLQTHVESAHNELELKDTALKNLEEKLQKSREECAILKARNDTLNSTIETNKKDKDFYDIHIGALQRQIEQQAVIIRNLQEALVQSKRAFDAKQPKVSSPGLYSETVKSKNQPSSKSGIVDI